MWLFSFLFGDPSTKKLKQFHKELEIIKSIEIKFREEINSIDQVQAKTHEFQSRFE
jgi:preprotein translocase subunit SecA